MSGGGAAIDDSLHMRRGGARDWLERRRPEDRMLEFVRPRGRALDSMLPGRECGAEGRRRRAAPSLMSLSTMFATCAEGRPVMATMSERLERPSIRDSTKPSTADSGSSRTSVLGTGSKTASEGWFNGLRAGSQSQCVAQDTSIRAVPVS